MTRIGSVISRTKVPRVTNLEVKIEDHRALFAEYDSEIRLRFKEDDFQVEGDKPNPEDWAEFMDFDEEFQDEFNKIVSDDNIKEADAKFTPEVFDDTYLNMELALPRDGGDTTFTCVTKCLKDANGFPIGTSHDNPILETRVYEVEYADEHKASMEDNAINMNLFAQVDAEGNRHALFDEISDHRNDGKEIKEQDAFITAKNGIRRRRETTTGCEMLIQWKDGSTTWVSLKDTKESCPLSTI